MKLRSTLAHQAFWGLLAVLVPVALLIAWYWTVRPYPVLLDDSEYFANTQRLWLHFKNEGFWQGFKALYWERHWRPIIMPALALPALALANGSIVLGAALFSVFCYSIGACATYLMVQKFAKHAQVFWPTLALNTMPWLWFSATGFSSEVPALALTQCLLYFALCHLSNAQTWTRICLAASAACLLAIRPVEALLLIGSLQVLYFFVFKKERSQQDILPLLVTPYLLAICWYLPFYKELVAWIIECTISPAAESAQKAFNTSPGLKWTSILAQLFAWPYALLLIAAGGAAIYKRKVSLTQTFAALGPFAAFFVVAQFSQNPDSRYYYYSALTLLSFFVLSADKLVARFLGLLSVMQILLFCLPLFAIPTQAEGWLRNILPQSARPVDYESDIHNSLLVHQTLKTAIAAETNRARVFVINLYPRTDLSRVFNSGLLQILALGDGLDWTYNERHYLAPFTDNPQQQLELLKAQNDYLLVGPVTGIAKAPLRPMSVLGATLVQQSQQENTVIGLQELRSIEACSTANNCGKFKLFRILNPAK